MNQAEIELLAEVAWKENRHGRVPGMQSIINNVLNRSGHKRYPDTIEGVIMQPAQYTSMSVKSDPEYGKDPTKSTGVDLAAWQDAQELAAQAAAGTLHDLTGGATLYFAPAGMPNSAVVPYVLPDGTQTVFPRHWNMKAVRYVCTVAGQLFFLEL